jgi:hypothetical protein
VFQGGPDEPYFLLDNIFNPYDGALWEQIETDSPQAPYSNFVSGLKYVTEFNTGNNPNWDYNDWGSAPQVTVVWQDYYVIDVTCDAPIRTGLGNTDAYTTMSGGGAQPAIIDTVTCFAKGTRIRTPEGDVNVEALQPGQMVLTARGAAKPVKWIGHRSVNCRCHPNPAKVWPIRVRAHAFGRSLPARDLLVSPQHALFDEGVLIPAKYLVNGHNVIQEPVDSIEYYHVELEQHDLLLAEGMPA